MYGDFMTYPLSPNSCLWNSANHHRHNYCKTQNYVRVILQLNTHTSDNILSKTFIFKPLKFSTKWLKIYCPFSLMFSHDKIYLQQNHHLLHKVICQDETKGF